MREFIGQRRLLLRVGAQALLGQAAHAYGITGPRSIGKRTAAIRLAQTLNCLADDRRAGGCGVCRACRAIEKGGHPDVTSVTRADDKRDITIEQIREMLGDLSLRPLEGARRVVIIDDASELSEHAEIALLKTLEEPPSHAVIMLLSATPEQLRETIRSRIQPLPFRLVATAEIAEGLAERYGKDSVRYAESAGGRPGMAVALASDEATRTDRKALEAEFYRLIGSGLTDRFAWAQELADDSDSRRRVREIERRLGTWSELSRDAVVLAQEVDRPMRPDRALESAKLSAGVGARDLVDMALLMEKLRRDIVEFNANPRLVLELLALRVPYQSGLAKGN